MKDTAYSDQLKAEAQRRIKDELGFDPFSLERSLTKDEFMAVLNLAVKEANKLPDLIRGLFVVPLPQPLHGAA